jgi:FkbM family methyltransferase
VIVDAGANIGLAALYFANTFPGARIIAVEPAACNISLLRKNTAHYPQIEVVEAALWKENAQLDLVDPGIGYWGFRTREQQKMPAAGGAVRQAVRGITIDALLEACAVDYVDVLKIDIEGAEVELFEHPGSWLDRVGLLIIELHDRMRPGCSRSVYRATVGFERAWETGENVYLARADACAAPKPGASSF